MVFTLLSTPVDCSCALCLLMFLRIKSRKARFLRRVDWFSEGDFNFSPRHLSSAALFSCPVSACYFDSV